ncbi:hypothetical protein BDQ12DRAFT_511154 [Crucibulum laeve]|uniref:Secreted protein n=1 Tax=Crucibulum laeve TaxID=68775 RepID=A0A5C3M4K1_9AGAR|nr:hypothetical protein BDQ12DRAFT_511154 [Crucibulum laeve]
MNTLCTPLVLLCAKPVDYARPSDPCDRKRVIPAGTDQSSGTCCVYRDPLLAKQAMKQCWVPTPTPRFTLHSRVHGSHKMTFAVMSILARI